MSDFNVDAYFANRAKSVGDVQQKRDAVVSASQTKIQQLQELKAAAQQRQQANEASWAGKLGLDTDGILGGTVNLGASAVSGASRLIGDVLALPASGLSANATQYTDEQDQGSFNRYQAGTATPYDMLVLNRVRQDGKTLLGQFQEAGALRQSAQDTRETFDLSGIVQQDNRQGFSEELRQGFTPEWEKIKSGSALEKADGVANLLLNTGSALLNNKQAVLEYIAENAPQLAVGAVGKVGKGVLTASNIGYAVNEYHQGLDKYAKENNGQLPPPELQREMAAWASSLALAENVGDLALLRGIKSAGTPTALALGGRLKEAAGTVASGFGTEALTEGYQTFAEGEVKQQPATAEQIYEGAVIGGAAGGGLSSVGAVAGLLAGEPAKPATTATPDAAAAFETATKSGDIAGLVDPKSPTYNPVAAIDALSEFSKREDVTPEVRQAKLAEAGKVLEALEKRKEVIETQMRQGSPEVVAELEAALAEATQSGDEAAIPDLTQDLEDAKAVLAKRDSFAAALASVEGLLEQSREGLARFGELSIPTDVDVDAELNALSTETSPEVRRQSTGKLLNLSMAAPAQLSDSQLNTLLSFEADLSAPQLQYLRAMSEARQAATSIKNPDRVTEEILRGGNGNLGLSDYRKGVGAAIASSTRSLADRLMAKLDSFAMDHAAKAAVISEAWKEFNQNRKQIQVLRGEQPGSWFINRDEQRSREEVLKNGGFTFASSGDGVLDFVNKVASEAKAISATAAELNAAVALKFSTDLQGEANVQNVPESRQAPVGSTEQGQAGQEPASTGEVGTSGGQGDLGPAATEPVVRGDGVNSESSTDSVTEASPDAVTPEVGVEGQNQSTENTSNNPDSTTTEQPAEQAKGTLTSFSEVGNLIAQYFTQRETPLAVKKGFFTLLDKSVDRALDFLPPSLQLPENWKSGVNKFLDKASDWAQTVEKNLPKKDARKPANLRHKDMMEALFIEGDGNDLDVDENVKVALAAAVWNWVSDEATRPRWHTPKQLNALLGRDKKARLPPGAMGKLGEVGDYQHVVVESLGQAVMQALGLKANKDAPQDLEAKLRVALGTHALKLMEDSGLIKRTRIPNAEISAFRGTADRTNGKGYHDFIAIARYKNGAVTEQAQEIWEANKSSKGIVGKMLHVASRQVLPSFAPITEVQQTTSGTNQGLPKVLKDVILLNQSRPWRVVTDKLDLMESLGEGLINKVIGVVEEDDKTIHIVNEKSVKAKNDGLKREYKNFTDWVKDMANEAQGRDTPFYLPFNVWRQQRVGIASNVVNPQTSKIVRFLIGSPDWKITIDPNNEALMNSSWLRVAEGLKVKTERADNASTIENVKKTIEDPVYADAIQAIQKSFEGTALSPEEKASIAAAVKAGKTNVHTLDVLIGLARMQAAKGGSFEVQMMGEVDGVANGTMINHILLGAGTQGMLNRGGFFEVANPFSQYNQWRDPANGLNNLDIYEATAKALFERINELFPPKSQNFSKVESIWKIAGNIFVDGVVTSDGRSLAKDAMNPLAFGSSLQSMVEGMSDTFVSQVYDKITELSADDASQKQVDLLVQSINVLIPSPKDQLPLGKPISWHMKNVFSKSTEAAIKKAFAETVGAATEGLMAEEFRPFLARKDALVGITDKTFSIFNALRLGMREALVEELIAKGELAVDAKGVAADLSRAQEAELDKRLKGLLPVIETSMSQEDRGNTGVMGAGKEKGQSKNAAYLNNTKFGTQVGKKMVPSSKGGMKPQTSINISGTVSNWTSPGVAMLSALTHSFDSGVSHRSQKDMHLLNVHDAVGAGVGGLADAARLMNKNTWEGLLNYSPMEEAYQSLARVVVRISQMQKNGTLPPQAVEKLAEQMTDLVGFMQMAKSAAYEADKAKLGLMKTWASVDQYAYQGGNYVVQKEDREAAEKKEAALEDKVKETTMKAVESLVASFDPQRSAGAKTTQESPRMEPEQKIPEDSGDFDVPSDTDTRDPQPKTSPFGKLADSSAQATPELVEFFKKSPETTSGAILKKLVAMLRAPNNGLPNAAFNAKLAQVLYRVLGDRVPISYLDRNSPIPSEYTAEERADMPDREGAAAWFSWAHKKVYVKGTDFEASFVSPEVVLHELTHAATALLIEDEYAKWSKDSYYKDEDTIVSPYSSRAMTAIRELETLWKEVDKFLQANDLQNSYFKNATKNVHELIAYGMTNPEFQKTVLAKISIKTGNKVTDGLQKFIDILMSLFGIEDKGGMRYLVTNVSVLLEESSKAKGQGNSSGFSSLPMAAPANRDYSTLDIHAALNASGISPAFSDKLADVLSSVSQKLHGPFGVFKAALMENQSITAAEVWANALKTGKAPFATLLGTSPFNVSDQELHAMEQVEAVMREVLSAEDVSARTMYRELAKLYNEMAETLTPADFANPAQYEFLFQLNLDGQNRSDHLARFVAFGMANQQVNLLLQRHTKTKVKATKQTFAEKLQSFFEDALEYLQQRMSRTFAGQKADLKLESLVRQLVDIEAKKRQTLLKQANNTNLLGPVEDKVKQGAETVREAIIKGASSSWVRNNKQPLIRAAGTAVRVYADDQVEQFMAEVNKFRNKNWDERLGFIAGTLNYTILSDKVMESLLRFRKSLEGKRKDLITGRAKMSREAFANKGEDMTDEQSFSITRVFLRTGLHVLLGQFEMAGITKLINDKAARTAAIAGLEQQLAGYKGFQQHFINKANALAYYRVTGESKDDVLLLNAGNIARLYGTAYANRFTGEQLALATQTIEKLVALYALEYSDATDMVNAQSILNKENQRTDGHGVAFVLSLHKHLEEQSKELLFQGQEALMQHGYTLDITNPNVDIKVANRSEGRKLVDLGYLEISEVGRDSADPDKSTKYLYVMRDGGLNPLLTGVMAYSDKAAKGSPKHSGVLNPNNPVGLENAAMLADILNDKFKGKNTTLVNGARKDLSKVTLEETKMVPVLNPKGEIVNWRYMMKDSTRDNTKVLERDNRFDRVLGVMAGSMFDKLTTTETNVKAIKALREQYLADGTKNAKSYVLIGPNSKDKENRETWAMLPEETKDAVVKVWGMEGMYVNHGMRDIVFGYRKLSLSDVIKRTQERRRVNEQRALNGQHPIKVVGKEKIAQDFEDLFTGLIEGALRFYAQMAKIKNPGDYAMRAAQKVAQSEQAWQEIVAEVKDILVIKTITTLIGNVRSNLSFLVMSGVPLSDILRDHLVALRGATAYQKDTEELDRLETLLATGQTQGQDERIKRQITLLKDSISRNPVKTLIDAGLMPSIVEDTSADDDIYSYKSKLTRTAQGVTNRLNPMIREAGNQIYMGRDTMAYQGLRRMTQLSDFMARYTQYQYLVSREENRLSKEDALQQASDDFVNYDIPMHRNMQYLDDMGIFMFTKYFLRIQKVIARLVRERPGRVLGAIALGQFMNLGPIVLDGSWVSKAGNNPFGVGALGYPGSIDEIATISAAGALVK
jgi:hypothetical protein